MAKSQYLVTARKYRPRRFADLVAQSHVVKALINAIRLDRLAHAYLFTGPRGVGKTTAARILAKAINCTEKTQDQVEPCLHCPSCEDFELQRSLSIFEIDAASNNKVEDIRELRENVQIPPQGGQHKVYIIDEVHMLSNAAFNALLKTLEEPPPHVLFIFATTEPHKVLPTILSRCQRFDFRRIPTSEIVDHLSFICEQEHITTDDDVLHLIAQKGDGALRDALSVFDQAIALCGTDLNYPALADSLRVVDVELYFEATRSILERDAGSILRLSDRIISDGYDMREFLEGLAEHTRNLMVALILGKTALVDVSHRLKDRYDEAAKGFTETTLLRLMMVIDEAQIRLPVSSSPRLAVELALVKMTHMSESVDLTEALEQIRRLEQVSGQASTGQVQVRTATADSSHVASSPAVPSSALKDTPEKVPPSASNARPRATKVSKAPEAKPPLVDSSRQNLAEARPSSEPATQVPLQQSPSSEEPKTPPMLKEQWNQILSSLEKQSGLGSIAMLKQSVPLAIRNQTLEIAVPSEIVMTASEHPLIKNALEQALQSTPDLAARHVKFYLKPNLFLIEKKDPQAEFEELKAKSPAVELLDSAFGLRLVPSS